MKPLFGYRRPLLATGLALVLGCGLSEYQSKYEKQQERINYLDQENQYLGRGPEPLEKKDSSDPASMVSLRFPVGISSRAEEKPQGTLYRYPSKFAKPPKDSDLKYSEIEGVYLAVDNSKDWIGFLKKTMEPFKGVDPLKTGKVDLEAPGRQARSFQTVSFTEGTDPIWSYQFFFCREKEFGVVVGFRGLEKAMTTETAKKAMELSIKSLTFGKGADSALRKSSS
jgi:hypothetical protein